MAWSFNVFTGNLDQTGSSGAVVFEGEVETFDDLPAGIGDPAVGASFLVRSSTGVWLVNRRQAGIWIRRNNTGVRATDWEYGGDYPVNSVNGQTGNVSLTAADVGLGTTDSVEFESLTVQNDLIANGQVDFSAASSLQLPALNTSLAIAESGAGITGTFRAQPDSLTANRAYDLPDRSGELMLVGDAEPIDYTVVTSATTLANGAKVAANTTAGAFTLTLPATPANGDTVSILDYAGTFDTNNLTIARNGSNIESLAEDMDCNIEDAAFSLVFVGSTVGWKVVPLSGTAIPINQQANDIEITDSAKGVILKSPNNTRWRLTINDNGTLQRVALPLIAFLCMTASALSQNVTDVVANTNGVLVAPTNFFTANLQQWVTGSYVYAPTNNFSVTNSATLTNIPGGDFTVSANTSYIYIASAYVAGSNGYHLAIELPSIANAVVTNTASSGLYLGTGFGTPTTALFNSTNNMRILFRTAAQTTNNPSFAIGTFRVGATGGTANLQFAQGVSSGNPSEITTETRVLIFPLP